MKSSAENALAGDVPFNKWFAVRFILLLAFMYGFMKIGIVREYLLQPWAWITAYSSALLLEHLGIKASLSGFTITGASGAIGIEPECAAVEVYAVFISAVAAVKTPLSRKALGISAGMAAIFTANIFRICALFILLSHAAGLFSPFHFYIGPALVIAVTFAVWVWWLSGGGDGFANGDSAQRHLLARSGIFFAALVLFLWLYGKFLDSNIGYAFTQMVNGHALALARFAGASTAMLAGAGQWQTLASCLAPPISVLYLAAVAAWPFRPLPKTGLFLLFFPLLYVLGVVKVAGIYLSSPDAVTRGFIYNQYYPAVFVFFFVSAVLFSFYGDGLKAALRPYGRALLGCAAGIAVWHFFGAAYETYLLAPCVAALSGQKGLAMDPYQALSSIPAWHIILTMTFFSFLRRGEGRFNYRHLLGLLGLFFILQVAVWSFFNLHPIALRAGYLRMFGIAPPLALWLAGLWRAKKRFYKLQPGQAATFELS